MNFSVHPVKKLCVGSKNDWHLFNGLDVLYHHGKFGEIELWSSAVVAKIWSRVDSDDDFNVFSRMDFSDAPHSYCYR